MTLKHQYNAKLVNRHQSVQLWSFTFTVWRMWRKGKASWTRPSNTANSRASIHSFVQGETEGSRSDPYKMTSSSSLNFFWTVYIRSSSEYNAAHFNGAITRNHSMQLTSLSQSQWWKKQSPPSLYLINMNRDWSTKSCVKYVSSL